MSEPENIPAATILIGTSEDLDKETYNTIKTAFDEYITNLPLTKSNRELIISVYKALASTQQDILDNQEILSLLKICHSILTNSTDIRENEVTMVYETFDPIISSRSDDNILVAKSLQLLNEISWTTLTGDSPSKLRLDAISGDHYSNRLFAKDLEGLSIALEGFNFTLPKIVENKYSIYDIYTQIVQTEGMPIFSTFLAEVGSYDRFKISFTPSKSIYTTDNGIFTFEIPHMHTDTKVRVKCQIFSYDTGVWSDTECESEVVGYNIRITSRTLGTYRLEAIEVASTDESEFQTVSECEMNPAPYAIVCVWFGIVIMMFMMTIMTRMNKPHLYRPVNLTIIDTKKTDRISELDNVMSPKSDGLPPIVIAPPAVQASKISTFFKQHILAELFTNQSPMESINNIGSFMSSMFFGFAVLGAFVFGAGDSNDNTNYNLEDISDDNYPKDLKYVFIALALTIPVALPLRVMTKMTLDKKFKIPIAILSMVTLIGSILGVLLMGAYFCQGASMRWTLNYLIYIPLELTITEFIVAAVVFMVSKK